MSRRRWNARTRAHESWVLRALNDIGRPVGLKAIYDRVIPDLKRENLLRHGEDPEYMVRWALSNLRKAGFVKNTRPGEGEWEITDSGRADLQPKDPEAEMGA